MKKRIIIVVSVVLIIFVLACCITEKELVIEIVPESSVPSGLQKTSIDVSQYYINGKENVTEAEQKQIAVMCSKDTQEAVRDKLKEISSSSVKFEGKAVAFDNRGQSVVYYFFSFLVTDGKNSNVSGNAKTSGSKVAKVTFERKSIILRYIEQLFD